MLGREPLSLPELFPFHCWLIISSLYSSAFCSGINAGYGPFHCWGEASLSGLFPVSLLVNNPVLVQRCFL